MIPTSTLPGSTQPSQPDAAASRFFLDDAFDANPVDGDWWLDIGGVDLPGSLAA